MYKRDQIHTCQQQWTEAKQCTLNVVSAIPYHTNAPWADRSQLSEDLAPAQEEEDEARQRTRKEKRQAAPALRRNTQDITKSASRRREGFLKTVIRNVVSCIEHAKRMAIMAMNIVNVLKRKLYVGGG
ncbi:hypothetical protein pipiens_011221 [Culex pipiens pipiens]|uniref:Uncharacterized protein n=1 Tax=Culex pipiens pipiens TaxID=38569 RepID=A0ABD1D802_CULPP